MNGATQLMSVFRIEDGALKVQLCVCVRVQIVLPVLHIDEGSRQ